MRIDKGHWPRSLLWHRWLPLLSGTNDAFPWSESAAQGAGHFLEQVLGAYSSRLVFDWGLPDGFDAADIALQISEHPNVGLIVALFLMRSVSSSGSGLFSHLPGHRWSSRRWGSSR